MVGLNTNDRGAESIYPTVYPDLPPSRMAPQFQPQTSVLDRSQIYPDAQPSLPVSKQMIRENLDQSQSNVSNNNIVNNISINVSTTPQGTIQTNVSQNSTGKNTAANNPANPASFASSSSESTKDLANKIRTEVIRVIGEQQRLGGALRR